MRTHFSLKYFCLLGTMLILSFATLQPAGATPPNPPAKKPGVAPVTSKSDHPFFTSTAVPCQVTGEVVDVWCYSSRSVGIGRGLAHKACAQQCVAAGAALGIVDDNDKLYIAAKAAGKESVANLLTPYIAKRVTVRARYSPRGGCAVLKIISVKEAKPAAGTSTNPSPAPVVKP